MSVNEKTKPVSFVVNGEPRQVAVPLKRTLLDVLRDDLHLTGTKCGCNQGVCGACTVMDNGQPIRACLALAAVCDGHAIVTIEGARDDATLAAVQRAFVEAGAVQCGFCTPGMIVSAAALLRRNPSPDRHEIREELSGNLCRCTGYAKILDAVALAASRLTAGEGGA